MHTQYYITKCWNAPAIVEEVKLKTMTKLTFLFLKLLFPSWELWIFSLLPKTYKELLT